MMEWLDKLSPQQRAVANKVAAEADRQGVPRELALAAAMQESKFDPKAKSKTGPIGVMQLGRAAALDQNVNRHNTDQNIRGGVGYLKQMLAQQNGDPQRALIAYHDGPGSSFFKGGSMSPEAYNHLKQVKSYGGFQGDLIPMATESSHGIKMAEIEPLPDLPMFTMGETVGRPRTAVDVVAGMAGSAAGAKFGRNVMPSHREQQLMQAEQRLKLLEQKQAIDAAQASKIRTFGGDVANWHPGQYREDISRNIVNPTSQADAAEQARQLEAKNRAAQRFGQTVQAGPESRIQVPVDAGGGPRGAPPKTPMPASVIPQAPVAQETGPAKSFLRSVRFPGGGALNALGGAGAAAQLYDAYERAQQGDYPGAALGAISGVGGGLGTFFPNPLVQLIGGGVGLVGAGAQYLYDKSREKDQKQPVENKAAGGLTSLPKLNGGGNPKTAALKAAVKTGEQLIGREPSRLFVPRPTRVTTMSEALGPHEGKYLGLTQTDNFGVHGNRMGGNQFPNFQNISPAHQLAGVTWMNDAEKHANDLVKNRRFNNKDVVYSTYIGGPDQLKSNKTVTNDILDAHYNRNLTPEQVELINNRIATLKDSKGRLVFPQAFDIRDRFATQELGTDTFARRGALASMLGEGEGVNKTRGGIALPQYQDILRSHRDPLTEGVPTSSVGTRIFTVDDRPAMFTKEFHPDYNWAVFGKDQQVQFPPVPQRLAVHDWHSKYKERFPTKEPHGNAWFSYPKDPQFIDEAYLTRLQKEGYADGGLVHMQSGGNPKLAMMKALASKALPAAERDANLQKFLLSSQEKRRLYHGTTGDVSKFNPNNRIHFLTPEPKFANSFATKSMDPVEGQSLGDNPVIKPGANVMPVHVQAENIFDPLNEQHTYALRKQMIKNYDQYGGHDGPKYIDRLIAEARRPAPYDNWEAMENPNVQDAIKDLGHDAFRVREAGVDNLGMYNAGKIKSAIGNEGTYNTRDLDVTKAEGGLVHLQDGGSPRKAAVKRLATSAYDMLGLTPESVSAWKLANAKPNKQQQDPVLARALDAYMNKQISQA
ncbi:LT_GEWL domain containing protein, partial [uncultured Caudovirales phage]